MHERADERAVIRVRATGMVFGDQPGDPGDRATVVVPAGTHGTLVTIGADRYRVIWDTALRGDDESGVMDVLRDATVDCEAGAGDIIPLAPLEFVEIRTIDPVTATVHALDDTLDDTVARPITTGLADHHALHLHDPQDDLDREIREAMDVAASPARDDRNITASRLARWAHETFADLFAPPSADPDPDPDDLGDIDIDAIIDDAIDDAIDDDTEIDDVLDRAIDRLIATVRRRVRDRVRRGVNP